MIVKLIKGHWRLISGFIGVAVGGFTLGLQTSSAIPSVGMDTVVISRDEVSAIFENNSNPSIPNFSVDLYLHYSDKLLQLSETNAGALIGSSGRRIIKFDGQAYSKADSVTVCISFSGPLGIDTIWQKFELVPSRTNSLAARHGIHSYYGGAVEIGRYYILGGGCKVNA